MIKNLQLPAGGESGFTLVETLAAVILLTVAIVAPMLLTVRALSSAYYARDQMTASYSAQEAIEAIHQIRDNQILLIAAGTTGVDIFGPLTTSGLTNNQAFTIDTTTNPPAIATCSGTCPYLQTDGVLYGYNASNASLTTNTHFIRTVRACYVQANGTCNSTVSPEIKITSTVSWQTPSMQLRSVTISEDLYRWLQ